MPLSPLTRLRPLMRLRLAFLGLGAVLLVPFGFLLDAVESRVEAQRQLRHEVVAERIFDELERELTAVLEGESARPSSAYDEVTRTDSWAPFVLGYFKLRLERGVDATTLLGREQLDPDRVQRLNEVLTAFAASHHSGSPGTPLPELRVEPRPQKTFAAKSSLDVLQKLNRGQEARSRRKAPETDRKFSSDSLQGY